jgi:branched-chain amino acid transport system substrate-binding protein
VKHSRRILSVVAALALVATGCGGGDDGGDDGGDGGAAADDGADDGTEGGEGSGPEGDPVIVGGIFDLSGATGDVGTPYSEGARDYVAWRNETQDGVGGRPLELDWQDYAYDVATAEQLYTQYVSGGAVAIQGWGTGDTEALRQLVAQDELPFMSASWAETLVDPEETPYNFVVGATYSDQMRVALAWIAEDSGGSAEVAVFHHDSPFGTSPVGDGETYIEEQGLDLEYQAYPMPGGATDYVGELSRASNADYIIIQNVASPAAQLVQDLVNQGGDTQVVCLNWCTGEGFIELAGDAAEGVVGVHPFLPPTAEAEGLSTISEYLESDGRSLEDTDIFYVQGWYTMHVMAEAIAQVVESGEEVTGPAIREMLESMEPVETGTSEAVDFTADSHRGMAGSNLFRAEGGVYVPFEEGVTP